MIEELGNKLNLKKAILVAAITKRNAIKNANVPSLNLKVITSSSTESDKNKLTASSNIEVTEDHLDELAELCRTLQIKNVESVVQKIDKINVRTYIGKGKVEEIKTLAEIQDAGLIIFDDDLSPSQVRNLEKILERRVIDRSLLILDIFAMRAKTAQAKTQVELAQYQYILPRLTRLWTHLSKQKGGNPGSRGPGEKELETDKRIIKDKIAFLKKKLAEIEQQGIIERKQRGDLIKVAFVGYTNTGKSTIMKILSKKTEDPENKLFATITSTVRKVVIKDTPFLITDTVGFIRKLPHTLIECFKSTLEEVRQADILIHVIDFSSPMFTEHIKIVDEALKEIGVRDVPTIMVFNKIDKVDLIDGDNENKTMEAHNKEGNDSQMDTLKKKYSKFYNNTVIFTSAKNKYNIKELKMAIVKKVKAKIKKR